MFAVCRRRELILTGIVVTGKPPGIFGAGVVQGVVSSASFGAVGAPKSSDSTSSLLGQAVGTAIEGGVGTSIMATGAGEAGFGLVAAPETAGLSLGLVVGGAVEVGVGGAMQVGAAENGDTEKKKSFCRRSAQMNADWPL
jgi:hypothetical protein